MVMFLFPCSLEIRFLICPELIVGRLFCEEMADNEVIVMSGGIVVFFFLSFMLQE